MPLHSQTGTDIEQNEEDWIMVFTRFVFSPEFNFQFVNQPH